MRSHNRAGLVIRVIKALKLIKVLYILHQRLVVIDEMAAQRIVLVASFKATVEHLGFRYFACCSHVDPLHPPQAAVMLHNYPADWARAFSELKPHAIDPVLLGAKPFSWDDAAFRVHLTRAQNAILAEAARLGLAHGHTIPIHLPRASYLFRREPPYDSLLRASALIPGPRLRRRVRKMLADNEHETCALVRDERFSAARWLYAGTWILFVVMIFTGPVSAVWRAISRWRST